MLVLNRYDSCEIKIEQRESAEKIKKFNNSIRMPVKINIPEPVFVSIFRTNRINVFMFPCIEELSRDRFFVFRLIKIEESVMLLFKWIKPLYSPANADRIVEKMQERRKAKVTAQGELKSAKSRKPPGT